jgi:cytochrome c oxidase assembly protein Cox11
MSPLLRFFVRLSAVFLIIFLIAQLFNRFCFFSYQCRPFYFSRYVPRFEGKENIEMLFNVESHNRNLDFYALTSKILTVPNRLNSVIFIAKNTSGKELKFKPTLKVIPAEFKKYLTRINCLCAQEYSLKPGQTARLEMEFFISSKITKDQNSASLLNEIVEVVYLVE